MIRRFQIVNIVWCSGYEYARDNAQTMLFINLLNVDAQLDGGLT